MSDKQKGLINAVEEHFSDSEHRFCVRHLWQNFREKFRSDVLKNQLWKIARCTTADQYEQYMEEMKVIDSDAYDWLAEKRPSTWVRAFQTDLPKCDILLNNNCEVFNKYILEARDLPIITMIDKIKSQLSSRHYSKQQECKKWDGPICPKIKKRLQKHVEWSSSCYPINTGEGIFQVSSHGRNYIVELQMKACTCRRWQVSGIPCPHAISCHREEQIDPEEMVHKCYALCNFSKAYAHIIMPCKDKREWQKMGGCVIKPPLYEKKKGRKAKNRRLQPEEVIARQGGKKITRHGTVIHCSHCTQPGHNKKGCDDFKEGLPATKPMDKHVRKRKRSTTSFQDQDLETNVTQQVNEPTIHFHDPSVTQPTQESVVTQEQDMPPIGSVHPHSMMEIMRNEAPKLKEKKLPGPLPESSFLKDARAAIPSAGTSTATRLGSLKTRVEVMSEAKQHATEVLHEQKCAAILAQMEADALQKAGENIARKEAAKAKRAEEREALKAQRKAKGEADAEARKIAGAAKKEAAAAKKKEDAEEKKRVAPEKKVAAEAKKRAQQEMKNESGGSKPIKVNMFDEFRS